MHLASISRVNLTTEERQVPGFTQKFKAEFVVRDGKRDVSGKYVQAVYVCARSMWYAGCLSQSMSM